MSMFPYVIGSLVVVGAACSASLATSPIQHRNEGLSCELRISQEARHVVIAAYAQTKKAVDGNYEMTIQQRSSHGRSSIRQSGEFALNAGESILLSDARLSGKARDIDAEISIIADGQTQACRKVDR